MRASEVITRSYESGAANLGQLPAPFERRFDQVNEQLAETSTQLNNMGANIQFFGAKGDYNKISGLGADNTDAFNAALATSNTVIVPPGNYQVKGRLNLRTGVSFIGNYKQSKIYFTTDNETLFMGSKGVDNATSFDHCLFENVDIYGLGKNYNQTGLNISGYLSEVRGCTIQGFKRGIIGRGVGLSMYDCYFVDNDIGFSLQDLIQTNGSLDYNTKINLERCTFVYNNKGMVNVGDGQTLNGGQNNVIGLTMRNCIFEVNTKAFDLLPFNGYMGWCWFENNSVRPTTREYHWVFQRNQFSTNGGDQTFDFIKTPGGGSQHYGTVELGQAFGTIKTRFIDFENFDTSGNDISTRTLIEEKRIGVGSALAVTDTVDDTTRELAEYNHMTNNAGTTQLLFNKISRFSIKPDGTLYRKGGDIKHSGPAVTRLGAGKYKIVFHTIGFQGIPHAFATSPTSITGDGDQDMYYCTTRMQATTGNSDYANFATMNVMYINTYKRPGAGGVDVLDDAWIHVQVEHA